MLSLAGLISFNCIIDVGFNEDWYTWSLAI